jgi:hypothetical protein
MAADKSAISRLAEVSNLRSKGLLSETEFSQLKAEILSATAPDQANAAGPEITSSSGGCSGFALFTVMAALVLPVYFMLSVGQNYSSVLSGISETGMIAVAVGLVVLPVLVIYLYFLPTFIAFRRVHPNRVVILVLNVLFGLTILGWALLLIWATRAAHLSNPSRGGESGLNVLINDRPLVQPELSIATARATATSELEALSAMNESGSLTIDEYTRLRAEVLSRL